MEDTIAAISSATGVGAISIIRVSGPKAIKIVNDIFEGKDLKKVLSHTINYGKIIDKKETIDEVLVSVMRKPQTFTMEDVVEINCHGGIIITQKVLELLLEKGCRLAKPGEFTKRAFLNGRIDLIKAGAVMDLIEAKTDFSRKMAINNLLGKTTNKIEKLREEIQFILANIIVNIDYPEYEDIEKVTVDQVKEKIPKIKKALEEILNEGKKGNIIKNGINTVIIGKPNVGKSSLLNLLIKEDKAIVTPIEGTTRDIVEGELLIDGILFRLTDTAGIRSTKNIIEKIGVEKSLNLMKKADLILFIVDGSQSLDKEEQELLEKIKEKPHIVIVNKMDLPKKINLACDNLIEISVKTEKNIDNLIKKIKEMFSLEKIEEQDLNYLTNVEALTKIKTAIKKLEEIEKNISKVLIDMLEIDIKEIYNLLGEILGKTYNEDLIDSIFKNFCLGK